MTEFGSPTFARFTRGPTPEQGIAAVAVTRLLDAGSTLLGLALIPTLEEANPVARAVFHEVGAVVGLVGLSVAAVVTVALVTEFGVHLVVSETDSTDDQFAAAAVRYLGYGVPSVISLAATIHNLQLTITAHPVM